MQIGHMKLSICKLGISSLVKRKMTCIADELVYSTTKIAVMKKNALEK
jgi:hypothetical protein